MQHLSGCFKVDEGALDLASSVPWFVRMWASVLRRAIVDWVLYRNHDNVKLKKLGFSAEQWIFHSEPDDGSDISSFESVCSMMGVTADFMRTKITALTEEQARRLRGMEFGDEW